LPRLTLAPSSNRAGWNLNSRAAVDTTKLKPIEQQEGFGRNPNMPLIWSNPPRLHR
jgi:hypothetical protein